MSGLTRVTRLPGSPAGAAARRMTVVVDDADREEEGDLSVAAWAAR
jgi:3,4-dihydroxy-2-butanone 4-phosphate synthase